MRAGRGGGRGGVHTYAVEHAWGVFADKGVPAAMPDKLNAEIVRVPALPDVKERYASFGLEAASSTPEQFAAVIRADAARYSKLIQATGAKVS